MNAAKTKSRLYKLTNRATGDARIVQAINQPQALGHVARTDWDIEALSVADAFNLAREGVAAEIAGAEVVDEPLQTDAFGNVTQ